MDTNRYADLVNMYANNVYKIAVSYCNNRSDAEDIVQNVFIKLLKSKEKFKDDEHVKRWLIRVAINESKYEYIILAKTNCSIGGLRTNY